MFKILILASLVNLGDVGNAKETIRYLQQKTHDAAEVVYIDASKDHDTIIQEFTQKLSQTKHNIVISIADNGLKALKIHADKELITPTETYVYWSGHQFFKSLDPKALHIDQVMLPGFAVSDEQKASLAKQNVKLTTTFGAPTSNPPLKKLKESYENWPDKNNVEPTAKYIIVMLPGDAPDIDGTMKVFTETSNKSLFDDVYALWQSHKDYEILVQNGPRTGRHDATTKQVICNHEYEKGGKAPLDRISEQFVALLKTQNIPYKFFNFGFEIDGDKKIPQSVANPLLYLSTLGDNIYVLSAESVSMVSQLTSYLDPSKIIAFAPDSMNAEHHKLLDEAFGLGYLSKFAKNGSVSLPHNQTRRIQNDAEDAATALLSGFHDKFPDVDLTSTSAHHTED